MANTDLDLQVFFDKSFPASDIFWLLDREDSKCKVGTREDTKSITFNHKYFLVLLLGIPKLLIVYEIRFWELHIHILLLLVVSYWEESKIEKYGTEIVYCWFYFVSFLYNGIFQTFVLLSVTCGRASYLHLYFCIIYFSGKIDN